MFASTFVIDGSGLFILFILVLVLVMNRTEAVFWVPCFMSSFFVLGFDFPYAFLIERKSTPAIADYFRKRAVVCFYSTWNVFLTYEISSEEHESIWRTWDITKRTTFVRRNTTTRPRGIDRSRRGE